MVDRRKPIIIVPLATSIAASSEMTTNPASHLLHFEAPGLTWRTSSSGAAFISGDFGTAMTVDFAAILSANAQSGTTIRVRFGSTAANVTSAPLYDSAISAFISPAITRTDGLYHSHHELPAPITARYWRIDIAGHSGAFEAAAVVLGKKIEPSRFYDRDYEQGVKDLGAFEISRNGVIDATPGLIYRTLRFKLGWLNEDEYETMFRPLTEQIGTRKPALWCFDPAATAYRQARTYFGYLQDSPIALGADKPRTYGQDFQIISMF